MFVAFEGLDGSGGTTQLARLAAALRRHDPDREVVCTREPSPGPLGLALRRALADETIGEGALPFLFAADRRDHLDRVVLPALTRGAVVLTDRYALSSFAYQAAAVGLDFVRALNASFPAPDVTILLRLDPEECLARIAARTDVRERFERLDRLRTIAYAYDAAVRACEDWRIACIDARGTPEEVEARIVALLPDLLPGLLAAGARP